MNDAGDTREIRARRLTVRLLLAAGGVLLGLLLAELVLKLLDRPHFFQAHQSPVRFLISLQPDGTPFYVNTPGGIRFVYDSNPRGYFGPDNEVDHQTNSLGFRGGEFQQEKPPDTLRIVFLGDSFTFGEGVHDADTYAEVTARMLRVASDDPALRVESYNLAVGAYNTSDSLRMLKLHGLGYSPDVVVLGFGLNDAEPPFFSGDPAGYVVRRDREAEVPEGLPDRLPPDNWFYRLRSTRLIWQFCENRRISRQTISHYTSLYEDSAYGWQESRRALGEIVHICRSHDIPCLVLLFPILHELSDDYPFGDIHAKIVAEAKRAGVEIIDLFPLLKGRSARQLWVHPTDQHPNQQVHAIAAQALVEAIQSLPLLEQMRAQSGD